MFNNLLARIAQGIERLPPEQKAVGSIPTAGTLGERHRYCGHFIARLDIFAQDQHLARNATIHFYKLGTVQICDYIF